MPQNRRRTIAPGAKSVGIRTKFKIGNRKSSQGAKQMSLTDLNDALSKVRKRDRNKLRAALASRGILPATA